MLLTKNARKERKKIMPTAKKVLQVVIADHDLARFQALMKKERRKSNSEMLQIIIEDYLNQYEAEHGKLLETSCDA